MPDFSPVIRQAYREILGRDPDPGGLAHWNSEMNAPKNMSEALLREELIRSEEYASKHGGGSPVPPPVDPPAPLPPGADLTAPIRGGFYYQWYPQTWHGPDGSPTHYTPTLGRYDSSDPKVIDAHIRAMDHAHIRLAICSWWGPGQTEEHTRMPLLMDRITALGSPLRVAIYFEKEGFGDPSSDQIRDWMKYVGERYASRPQYARYQGRPLVFVYNADDRDCAVVNRWSVAVRDEWYLVMKVFDNFASCPGEADAWHQYGPDVREVVFDKSFVISPGYWQGSEAQPRLARDLDAWRESVRNMVGSRKEFQLIISINEQWEGTPTESCQGWESASGHGAYMDVLHDLV